MAKTRHTKRASTSASNRVKRVAKRGKTSARVTARKTKIAEQLKAQRLRKQGITGKVGTRGMTITKERIVDVGIAIGVETMIVGRPQSIRGSFGLRTQKLVSSVIIHFILYEPITQSLYIQLTAAGEGRDYTYFNVSFRAFERFRDAPSKGRHFNRHIRNTQKWGFHYNFGRGKHF